MAPTGPEADPGARPGGGTDDADSFPRQAARTRRFTLGAPRDLRVSRHGGRVCFLRSGSGQDPRNHLWALDLAPSPVERLVVDATEAAGSGDGEEDLPEAERARRERARELAGGIVAYDADPDLTRATFVLAGRVLVVDVATGEAQRWPAAAGAFDPRLDPTGRRVAYVAGGELRVTDGPGGDGDRGLAGEDDPEVTWGLAEFVAAEEMHRTRGFWWSPGGDRVLAARVDTSPVERWHLAAPVDPWVAPRPIRYPMAGTANADVELWVLDVAGGPPVAVDWSRGEFEYLCAASWAPREQPTLVVQSRDQRTVAVLVVDGRTGTVTERARIRDPAWVELVPGAPAWAGDRLVTVEDLGDTRRVCLDREPISPPGLQVRRLLEAEPDAVVAVATADPTEAHVVRIGLDGSVEPLTSTAGVHTAAVGGGTVVISSAGSDHDGVAVSVWHAGRRVTTIASLAEVPLVQPRPTLEVLGRRELRAALVLPRGFRPEQGPLPVLLDPYGGPHALRVQRTRAAFATSQWLADQGFAVVVCDGRGTPARGPAWERAVRGDLAGPVLEDQVDALSEMAGRHGFLDLGRVAIRGWSFGGYLAALAVLRAPEVFHAAVAGAPVTEWGLYDTHYTERYLGDPRAEPESYRRSDLTPWAPQLRRPLLLIHGLADDNVVVAHTLRLSRALLEHGRPHRVLPLSGVTHMTRQETVAENLLRLEVEFLREALGLDGPAG